MSKRTLALLLLLNTAVIVPLYFLLASLGVWFITPIYLGAATVLGLIFIVYNRGFAARNAKPEELPSTMSREEKLAYIQEGKELLNRSRWMLTLILPFVAALIFDMLYLYLLPYLKEML